mmetsp:Transcript_12217/g.27657  ORF Transcript_12217/g.27657 Transcript_12217/m.27657 type:complete len:107 (+) Transcript_12217:64-384(+)
MFARTHHYLGASQSPPRAGERAMMTVKSVISLSCAETWQCNSFLLLCGALCCVPELNFWWCLAFGQKSSESLWDGSDALTEPEKTSHSMRRAMWTPPRASATNQPA